MKKERQPGFYWVKLKNRQNEWEVAEYAHYRCSIIESYNWYITADEDIISEDDFDEIDETPIIRNNK